MTQLLFLRHAETNMAGRFCGHTDPPLNERGRGQVTSLLAKLSGIPFAAVHSSDLLRAKATAEQVSRHFNVPLTMTPKLREIFFGKWEGLLWSQIEVQDAAYARQWLNQYPHLPAPDGESYSDFQARVLTEVALLNTGPTDEGAAVVTHGGVMRVVLQELCGRSDRDAWELTKSYCCSFLYDPAAQRCEVIS